MMSHWETLKQNCYSHLNAFKDKYRTIRFRTHRQIDVIQPVWLQMSEILINHNIYDQFHMP
jgi:hypothetical protein